MPAARPTTFGPPGARHPAPAGSPRTPTTVGDAGSADSGGGGGGPIVELPPRALESRVLVAPG
ncbi:hypothetical protein ACFPM0_31455 [Pseudonocardia sulfidoxydans]|uniref:hypothetical protein n=1 Tax=Pseudonocardia sulfidoxydans TaxID=54011 RepID=UPI003615496B